MSLSNASVLVGGTVATTGGTATTLKSKGNTLDQHNLVLDDGSSLADQSVMTATAKSPKPKADAPSGYTQARNTILMKVPLTVASGLVTINTIKIELSADIETTDAQRDNLRVLGAQALADSDFADFWNLQSVD